MKNIDNDSRYPAMDIIEKDPQLAASVSKLERNKNNNNNIRNVNSNTFMGLLNNRAKSNSDISGILKLLPDVALGKQIMISCILSPKDMLSSDLLFLTPKDLFAPDLNGSVITLLKRYFNQEYKIKEVLPAMLEEALYDKGSYPVAVIPESAIDDFINGNTRNISEESFRYTTNSIKEGSIGVLGNSVNEIKTNNNRISLESIRGTTPYIKSLAYIMDNNKYVIEDYVSVIDNIDSLKQPSINKLRNKIAIKSRYSKNFLDRVVNEDLSHLSDDTLNKLVFRNRKHEYSQVSNLPKPNELSRKTIGKPLIMKLPSEAVIPVYVPGNVKQHIGYYVLLDDNGNPIEEPDGDHDYSKLKNSDIGSDLIRKVESSMGVGCCRDGLNQQHSELITNLYADLVEKDLLNRLKNGAYTEDIEISRNEEVYRIMLSRVLSKKRTQLLYIPIDYLTYVAFKYNDNGIGKSILEDSMTINTLRVVMLFTDLLSSVKNSIGRTRVNVTLPDKDPNPVKTMEKVIDEVVRVRSIQLPMSMTNPNDITDFVQKSGLEFSFDGNASIPNLKIEYDNVNTTYVKSDSELQESLKNASISSLGLSPEVVNNSNSPEFATTIVANNALLSKRIVTLQDAFSPQISDHLRKIAAHSEGLILDLKQLLETNMKSINIVLDETDEDIGDETKNKLIVNKALNDLLSGFYVELPKPNSGSTTMQLDDLKTYTDGIDTILNDAFLSEDLFSSDTVGDLSNMMTTVKSAYKSYFIRKYMADKGVLPELSDILSQDEFGKPLIDLSGITKQHLSTISKEVIGMFSKLQKIKEKNTESVSKFGSSEDSSENDSSDEGSTEDDPEMMDMGEDPDSGDVTDTDDTGGATGDGEVEEGSAQEGEEGEDTEVPDKEQEI